MPTAQTDQKRTQRFSQFGRLRRFCLRFGFDTRQVDDIGELFLLAHLLRIKLFMPNSDREEDILSQANALRANDGAIGLLRDKVQQELGHRRTGLAAGAAIVAACASVLGAAATLMSIVQHR